MLPVRQRLHAAVQPALLSMSSRLYSRPMQGFARRRLTDSFQRSLCVVPTNVCPASVGMSISRHQQQQHVLLPNKRSISVAQPRLKSSIGFDAPTHATATTAMHEEDHPKEGSHHQATMEPIVPQYLQDVYWWAYLHPNAIKVFERQWLIDAILWGNFNTLRDAALDELSSTGSGATTTKDSMIEGRTLQVACVYGNFTELLAQRMTPRASLDVLDVAPIQVENLRTKLEHSPHRFHPSRIAISRSDAANLERYPNDTFDQVVFFFLLHEMPHDVRRQSVAEAARVLKDDGGKIVFVDYHRPVSKFHPLRYLMPIVLNTLEPFAMDLWNHEIQEWLPQDVVRSCRTEKELYFGGLYQKVVVTKNIEK